KTVTRSSTGKLVSSNSLKAAVGIGGISVQQLTLSVVAWRLRQTRRYGSTCANCKANSASASSLNAASPLCEVLMNSRKRELYSPNERVMLMRFCCAFATQRLVFRHSRRKCRGPGVECRVEKHHHHAVGQFPLPTTEEWGEGKGEGIQLAESRQFDAPLPSPPLVPRRGSGGLPRWWYPDASKKH